MRNTTTVTLAVGASLASLLLVGGTPAQSPSAGSAPAGTPPPSTAPPAGSSANAPAPPVEFTPEFLGDPKNVQKGREVWQARCQLCHGKTAYPGKAPRLTPYRYTPAFVYDRVANGFQAMPSWRHEFSVDELKAVVAYVMSPGFSN